MDSDCVGFGFDGRGLEGACLITGLPLGETLYEKRYEELLMGDNPKPTSHPRSMKANEDFITWSDLEARLSSLELALNVNDVSLICTMM